MARMRMDRDANYVAVGAFVLLVMALCAVFAYWYTGQQDPHHYQRYEINFQGTVNGLSVGSPVRYLGVDVGKVARITLDRNQPNLVLVLADIDTSAPIGGRTRASLSLQGITGLLYVDLEQDPKAAVDAPPPAGRQYPVIVAVPSDFDVLVASLPALATRALEMVDHVNAMLSDTNVRAFTATLQNAQRATERLTQAMHEMPALVADMRRTVRETEAAVSELRAVEGRAAPAIADTLRNLRRVSVSLADAARRLDGFVAANEPALSQFSQQGLPQLERLLQESRDAVRDFRDLSRSLEHNPSQLLYETPRRGVAVDK